MEPEVGRARPKSIFITVVSVSYTHLDVYKRQDLVGDNLWNGLSYDGQIYAVPLQASACLLVGNKQLFDEAGVEFPTDSWTEEEFRDAAVKMTNADKKQYGVIYAGSISDWPRALYGNGDTQIYDWDQKKMNAVGNEAVRHAWDLLVNDLMIEQKAAPAVMSSKDIGGGFETGKYGMALIGYWDIAEIHKVVQDSFEWDLIPLPVSEEYGQWRTTMYANALSISANSQKKEAAFEYIKWTLAVSYTHLASDLGGCVLSDLTERNRY